MTAAPVLALTAERFAAVYERWYPYTVGVLRAKGCRHELAEDCAQFAWMKIWEHRNRLRCCIPEALSSYARVTAIHLWRRTAENESRLDYDVPDGAAKVDLDAPILLDQLLVGLTPIYTTRVRQYLLGQQVPASSMWSIRQKARAVAGLA